MDIIILIFLSFKIRKKAKEKGETPWTWILRLISLFITTELIVAFAIISFIGMEKILLVMIPALLLALLSAFTVFYQLNQIQNSKKFEIEDGLIEEEEKPNLDHFR